MQNILLILTIISTTAFAQNDELAVKELIDKVFGRMKKTDTALIRLAFSQNAILQIVVKIRKAKCQLKASPWIHF